VAWAKVLLEHGTQTKIPGTTLWKEMLYQTELYQERPCDVDWYLLRLTLTILLRRYHHLLHNRWWHSWLSDMLDCCLSFRRAAACYRWQTWSRWAIAMTYSAPTMPDCSYWHYCCVGLPSPSSSTSWSWCALSFCLGSLLINVLTSYRCFQGWNTTEIICIAQLLQR